jgi:hypothetical protein
MNPEREEILQQGFVVDEFLATDADCPVFGVNLACAYPFPAGTHEAYALLASQLQGLDGGVYVYPLWETHVTIMTFINFSRWRRPSEERVGELRALLGPIGEMANSILDSEKIAPFALEFQPPVLSRKAAILPAANPTGEITRLRRRAAALLEADPAWRAKLQETGWNVPGIIHSTVLRFARAPQDPAGFIRAFDAVAAGTRTFRVVIPELLLTLETKPYMRAGEILRSFPLSA